MAASLRENLKEWVKDYCRNNFLIENPDYDEDDPESEEYIEQIPGGVDVFLDKAEEYFGEEQGVQSESLGDYSVSFDTDIPASLLKLLQPYRKVRFR